MINEIVSSQDDQANRTERASEGFIATHRIVPPVSYATLSQHCFQGDIVSLNACEPFLAYKAALIALLQARLDDEHPPTVHHRQSAETLLPHLKRLQTDIGKHPILKSLWLETLRSLHWDLGQMAWDFTPLRIVPPNRPDLHPLWRHATTQPHRDTWGSNMPCQINWWASLFPLRPDNTIGFWPAYFDQPVANDTATWSFQAYKASLATDQAMASAPSAKQPPPLSTAMPLMPNALGHHSELACFSSQQLHVSIPNRADAFRFSIELRTIHIESALHPNAHNGAANVDNAQTVPQFDWFKNIETGEKIKMTLEQ